METFKHEDLGHSTYSNAAQIDEKDDIIQRLTMKVSKQALELQDLSSQLEVSRQLRSSTSPVNRSIGKYSRTDDEFDASGADGVDGLGTSKRDSSRTSYIFSSTAAQRRYEKEHHESMVAMQRQLDATEAKLADHIKARRKLIQDLDAKTRESKFLIKRCQELQSENEKMRVQMENALRLKENSVLALQEQSRGFHSSGQSIGLTAKQLTIRASDKIYQQQLMEEVKMHQELLQEAKKELSASKDREQQQRLKVKVLEDALEVRLEEIGLSGHSDLLAKLAKLRGEVTALKSELKAKRDRITDCEESHSNMQTTHQQMAQQVKTLQQRLAESQRETYRLQHGDVGEMLKVAEAERDRLLHFVQSDMEKSTKLARQVEQLEAELRTSKAKCELLEERSKANETEVENQRKRSKMIESKAQKESRLLSELQQNVDLVNKENDSLKQRLGQKTVEAEELNKVQMNLFMQLQGKDEEILKYSEELVKLKAKVRDYEYSVPGLTSDKSRIEQELDETRQQLINAQRSLRELEPELERIRPEYMELRSERGMWQLERSQLKQEINRLQPLQQLLDDLHSGIMGLNHMDAGAGGGFKSSHGSAGVGESKIGSLEDLAMRSPRAYPGTPGGLSEASTPPAPPPPLTAVSPSNTPELSQRHSMWVALPQLRNLSAPLYEKIRSLAHDLHIKEMQCLEMQRNLVRLRSEANVGRRESEARAKQLQIVHDGTNHTIAALQERVAASEAEADHNRGAKALLEQIKVVMASYPVSWEALEYGHHAKNMDQSFSSECTSSNAIFLLEKATDPMLPELIGKALMYNSSSVAELAAVTGRLRALQEEHEELVKQHEQLQRDKMSADNTIFDLKDKLSIAADKLNTIESESAKHVGEAVELAEKQNALTISLEAKIESLHRDQKLKMAQVTALQQRDASIRAQLLAALKEACQLLNVSPPDESNKLTDLLQFNSQLLKRSIQGTVVSFHHPKTNSQLVGVLFPEPTSSSSSERKTPVSIRKAISKTSPKGRGTGSGSGSSDEKRVLRKRKSKTTSSSKAALTDSHTDALQDRLRKAQHAFAAMREATY